MSDSDDKNLADAILKGITDAKAEMAADVKREEDRVRLSEAFNVAAQLVPALEALKKVPGSTFEYKVGGDKGQFSKEGEVFITTNIPEGYEGETLAMHIDAYGNIRPYNFSMGAHGGGIELTGFYSEDELGYGMNRRPDASTVEEIATALAKRATKAKLIP